MAGTLPPNNALALATRAASVTALATPFMLAFATAAPDTWLQVSLDVRCHLRISATLILIAVMETSIAEIPDVFIDPGACPGEGCTYCEMYSAGEALDLFEKPSTESKVIGHIQLGETFLSKTGEVHTVPTRFEIHEASGPFKPGDDVYALTYGGEGYFRVFHNGELKFENLEFSPLGGGAGKTCDKPEYCFGQLTKELDFTWWIFVLSENGSQGWVPHDRSMRWIEPNP